MAIKVGQGIKNAGIDVVNVGDAVQSGDPKRATTALATAGLSETSMGKKVVDKYFGGPKTNKVNTPAPLDTSVIDVRNIDANDPRLQIQAAQINPFSPINATQIASIDPAQAAQIQAGGNFNQAMAAQSGLLGQLQAQSTGQAPSIADMQMQRGMEANLAAQQAALASARGGLNPLMARQTLQTSADIQAKTAQDAAMARLQEQMAAQQQLATVSGQARTQSFEEAAQQAQMQQQANLANMQANLQRAIAQGQITASEASQMYQAEVQRSMQNAQFQQQAGMQNANNFLGAMQMGINRDLGVSGQFMGAQQADMQAAQQAAMYNAQAAAQRQQQEMQRNMAVLQAASQVGGTMVGGPVGGAAASQATGAIGGAATGGGGGGAGTTSGAQGGQYFVGPPAPVASDETLKTDVKDASKDIKDFLSTMGAHDYEYKDEKHGKGRFVSPMAQELEKSKLGKTMVVETGDGKMVDYQRGYGFLMAAASYLNNRIDQIDGKKKKGDK